MPKLQGLIFDLEGTLLDGVLDLHRALNSMLALHKRRPLSLEEVRRMSGEGLLVLMQRALELTGSFEPEMEMAYFKQFIDFYRAAEPDTAQIYPFVLDALKTFHESGVKLGICTNKPERATKKILEDLKLDTYFSFVAGGDTFQVHKPNPGHLLGVIEGLGVPADSCVMVGDGSRDVTAAHKANVFCILVTQGEDTGAEELGADKVIRDFSELPAALKGLGL